LDFGLMSASNAGFVSFIIWALFYLTNVCFGYLLTMYTLPRAQAFVGFLFIFARMIHASVEGKIPQIIQMLKKHKVKRAYVFGSVCTGHFTDTSDVDLLIAFEEDLDPIEYGDLYWSLDEKLPQLLNRPVDLLTEKQLRNPYFIKVMNRTKTPLYEG
jgi:predicted nucleotidyltransferase